MLYQTKVCLPYRVRKLDCWTQLGSAFLSLLLSHLHRLLSGHLPCHLQITIRVNLEEKTQDKLTAGHSNLFLQYTINVQLSS